MPYAHREEKARTLKSLAVYLWAWFCRDIIVHCLCYCLTTPFSLVITILSYIMNLVLDL